MRIIEITAQDNGAHRNQAGDISVAPEGWAVIPADMETPNFPFGEITVDESTPPVVTSWTPGEMPAPEATTPAQVREEAYNTDPVIAWAGEQITVTQASQLWQHYAAEGSKKAVQLQALISATKAQIRESFPDVGGDAP